MIYSLRSIQLNRIKYVDKASFIMVLDERDFINRPIQTKNDETKTGEDCNELISRNGKMCTCLATKFIIVKLVLLPMLFCKFMPFFILVFAIAVHFYKLSCLLVPVPYCSNSDYIETFTY